MQGHAENVRRLWSKTSGTNARMYTLYTANCIPTHGKLVFANHNMNTIYWLLFVSLSELGAMLLEIVGDIKSLNSSF